MRWRCRHLLERIVVEEMAAVVAIVVRDAEGERGAAIDVQLRDALRHDAVVPVKGGCR
jgi:hypothetical protein